MVLNHAVPLNMDIVKDLREFPTGLDFYRFLAYRNNSLTKDLILREERKSPENYICFPFSIVGLLRNNPFFKNKNVFFSDDKTNRLTGLPTLM
jgi:hypothetical protein